ncbi:MAG: cell division protein FtsZ, partial [Bacteroidales bacterium]|nr:cell division protein FtsZ [Bacteroidales bacterium]
MPEMLKFEHPKDQSNIIKVIGVGGGGSNAVTHMFEQGIKGVDFILCNTDSQALDTSPVPTKVHLGKRELGAGNDPAVGRDAALATVDEFRELLEK